jgi:NAD(P)-dependent dehydrogenase (short-subunit alcohol dehydrogenase family)
MIGPRILGFIAIAALIGAALGDVSILVNNAGIGPRKPFFEITEEDWDQMLRINLKSMFDDFSDLNDSAIPDKLPWRLVRFAAGIGFDLDWDKGHAAKTGGS